MSNKVNVQNKDKNTSSFLGDPKNRSRIYTGLFLIAAVVFFIVNNANGETEQGPYPPNYNDTSIEVLSLSSLKGKIVIIDFWATWCPPCIKGIPDLIELKKENMDSDFEVIGISLDSFTRGGATKDKVSPFMKEKGINYPIVVGDQQVAQLYGGIRSIPTSFVIDKEGYIVSYYQGLVSLEQLKKDIKKANSKDYTPDTKYIAPDFTLPLVK
jgi:cytochrome c biogenesis protein CcmG/thiol:disulfide interchange protein DsbE